jgi:RimJ/RimL family protein N-acetyltransferase
MNHNIQIDGLIFRLRPIRLEDASLIVALRSDAELTRFLHPIELSVTAQESYLELYFKREHDYYFVIERISNSTPEGLISLYDIDLNENIGEFGRWIVKKGSFAALESAYLLYSIGFDLLNLNVLRCHTIIENKQVVSFHQSCGLYVYAELKDFFNLNGTKHSAVEQRITKQMWATVKPMLYSKISMLKKVLDK